VLSVRALLTAPLASLALALARASTAVTYAAAGTLTLAALERHAQRDWHDFGLGQTDQDIAAGLFAWEQDFCLPFLKPGDRILVVGCGGGRDLLALLERGYRAAGLEPVASCTALAARRLAERGLRAELITGAIETADVGARFDVFLFSWFCYSYIPTRARRVAVLGKVRTLLPPDGRVLISYIRAQPAPRRSLWRLARAAAWATRSDWRPEYGDVVVTRADNRCLHYEHRFQPDEIEAEAMAAGLSVACHDKDGDGNLVLVHG
jgi:SAM-dependent methyltransferase